LLNGWKLSQDLKNLVSEIIKFLPSARLGKKKQDADFEVFSLCNDTVQEVVHVATRLSYYIFIIWNLVIIASHRADDAEEEKKLIVHELLLHHRQHNKLVSDAQNSPAAGSKNTKFDKIMESRSRIDKMFLKLVMKELAEWGQDEICIILGRRLKGGDSTTVCMQRCLRLITILADVLPSTARPLPVMELGRLRQKCPCSS
jgi:hypothetical protein